MTLEEIAKRDAESAETWFRPFQGPQQFGAAGRAFVDRRWLLAHISTLRNDLTAARLERDEARNDLQEVTCGDVMYTSLGREVERLRHEVSRLNMRCEAMGWMLYPHSDPAREAVAGDIGWPGSTALTAYDRLQAALFRHACYCGCGDPNPDLHHPDCVYRQAHG